LIPSSNEARWATLAHLTGLLWLTGFPFAGSIGAAIVYAAKRSLSPYVAGQTREAQNFQNTISLAVIVVFVVASAIVGGDMIGTLRSGRSDLSVEHATIELWTIALAAIALAVIMMANIVFSLVAAITAHGGAAYRYPVCIRWVRP
jgi:uncharacterized Tic20 family protein